MAWLWRAGGCPCCCDLSTHGMSPEDGFAGLSPTSGSFGTACSTGVFSPCSRKLQGFELRGGTVVEVVGAMGVVDDVVVEVVGPTVEVVG